MTTLEIKPEAHQLQLTKGCYGVDEAKELIGDILKSEMNIQKIFNLRLQMGHQQDCLQAQINMDQLRQAGYQLDEMMQFAQEHCRTVKVESVLRISFQ